MNALELKNLIASGKIDSELNKLYGDSAAAAERYASAVDSFSELYGERDNLRLFSAPGRTEIGGNHTDHQHGCVLAGSVNLDVIAVVSPNGSDIVRIKSEGYPMDEVSINELQINTSEYGKACSLIRGVLAAFKNAGYTIGGFDAYTTSNVLKGSGLSSSAAFEVLVSSILNGLFNNWSVSAIDMAKYSQFAEREYFGKPCGLLDQMASASGGFTYADFNDPKNPIVEKITPDLASSGCVLCVVDTGGNHADLTQDYADITIECKNISRELGVQFLRDANSSEFYKRLGALRAECGDRAVLRAFHFFNENARVEKQRIALKNNDMAEFLRLVNASGDSSYKYLQNLYSNSAVSEQGLCLALALTHEFLGCDGACRVHGGGFAGTIQCYIPKEKLASYKQMIEAVFGVGSCVELAIRPVGGYEISL